MFLQTTTFLGRGRAACVALSVRPQGQVQVVLTDYYFSEASAARPRGCSYRLLLLAGPEDLDLTLALHDTSPVS